MRPSSQSHAVAWAIRALVCLSVHGCTTATGGAVELSWKLKGASGTNTNFIDCGKTGIPAEIRLAWTDDVGSGSAEWDCSLGQGVTGFALHPGQALLEVIPICASEVPAASDTYIAPAPEQRAVIAGDTISLNAVELVLRPTICL